jgi:hypothetical protein
MPSEPRSSRTLLRYLLCAAVFTACEGTEQQAQPQTPTDQASIEASDDADMDPSALADFREPLAPYGTWVDDPTYGTVWVPSVEATGSDFVPYVSGGHWALTADDQWIWVSDYPWGWAPFHYGRWLWIDGRGWAWIPGRVYAPAWVAWRTGAYDEAYIGWAPLPPAWYWRGGVAVRFTVFPPARYVFVPSRYAFHSGWHAYIVPAARVNVVAAHTAPYAAAHASTRYRALAVSRGPTPSEARIPAEAVPAQRVGHDPRATTWQRSPARPASPGRRRGGRGRR